MTIRREHSSGVVVTVKPEPKPVQPPKQVVITMPATAAKELENSLTAMPFTQDVHPVMWDLWDLLISTNTRRDK